MARDPDEPPAWISQFQGTIRQDILGINSSVSALSDLVAKESSDRKKDVADLHSRIDDLTSKLEAVAKTGPGATFKTVPPPDGGNRTLYSFLSITSIYQ